MTKLKEYNKRLEREAFELQSKRSQQILKHKKRGVKKIHSMNREIAKLKLEIAESKSREDHHGVDLRKVRSENESLKNQVEALRQENNISAAPPSLERTRSVMFRMRDQLTSSFSTRNVVDIESTDCVATPSTPEGDGNLRNLWRSYNKISLVRQVSLELNEDDESETGRNDPASDANTGGAESHKRPNGIVHNGADDVVTKRHFTGFQIGSRVASMPNLERKISQS
eukprot:4116330-Ditylum_brightwellii.AAC.1